jgi:predicted DNA-binding ribbon-helix-helix protein
MLLAGRVGVSVMKTSVIKHSIVIDGHKTNISLEDDFWNSLKEIADRRGETLSNLIANIDAERKFANLSSAIRLFVLGYYQDQYNREPSLVPN